MLFGLGGLGAEALNQSRAAWLIYYYAPPADADREQLLGLTTVTALLFAGRLLEAFDDVLIGYLSDRTRSRLGRRLPFIVAGAPFWALFAVLIFVPPTGHGTLLTAGYFFLMLQGFQLAATLCAVPYEALLPEIARSRQERVSVSAYRVAFRIAGAALGLIGSGLLVHQFGFAGMVVAMAGLALATRYLGVAAARKRSAAIEPAPDRSFGDALRAAFQNRHFIILMPSWMLFQLGLGLIIGALPFYASAILRQDNEALWTSVMTAAAIGSMTATLPFFNWLSKRSSPERAYSLAMLAAAAAFPLLALPGVIVESAVVVQALAVLAVAGAPVAAVYLFPGPLIADIAGADLERTGVRREATFYGGQSMVDKTVGSSVPLLLGLILLLGNTAGDPLGVRLVGPVAGLMVLAAHLVFRRFDLPSRAA